jgi:hypothetical protein
VPCPVKRFRADFLSKIFAGHFPALNAHPTTYETRRFEGSAASGLQPMGETNRGSHECAIWLDSIKFGRFAFVSRAACSSDAL